MYLPTIEGNTTPHPHIGTDRRRNSDGAEQLVWAGFQASLYVADQDGRGLQDADELLLDLLGRRQIGSIVGYQGFLIGPDLSERIGCSYRRRG